MARDSMLDGCGVCIGIVDFTKKGNSLTRSHYVGSSPITTNTSTSCALTPLNLALNRFFSELS